MSAPRCPRCGTDVGATWRWCLACGYDPDGAQRRIRDEHIERHLRRGSWMPAVVVVAGMAIGALIMWRTAPGDDVGIKATPTAVQPVAWQEFVPAGEAFRAEYPSPPFSDDGVASADGRPQQRYVAVVNQQFFGVVVTDTGDERLDAGVSDADARAALESFVARSARIQGASVVASESTHVSAAPALDYELDAGVTTTHGRAVLVGRQVFDVQVAGEQLDPTVADRFLQSFALS